MTQQEIALKAHIENHLDGIWVNPRLIEVARKAVNRSAFAIMYDAAEEWDTVIRAPSPVGKKNVSAIVDELALYPFLDAVLRDHGEITDTDIEEEGC